MPTTDIRQGLRELADLLDQVREDLDSPEVTCWQLIPVYVTVRETEPEPARAAVRALLGGLSDVTVAVTPGKGPFEFTAEGTLGGLRVIVLAYLAVCDEAGMVPVEVMQPRYTFNGAPVAVAP